jgi:hypothetical protein
MAEWVSNITADEVEQYAQSPEGRALLDSETADSFVPGVTVPSFPSDAFESTDESLQYIDGAENTAFFQPVTGAPNPLNLESFSSNPAPSNLPIPNPLARQPSAQDPSPRGPSATAAALLTVPPQQFQTP